MGRSTVPDSGEILTQQHQKFRKRGTARIQSKTGMTAYLDGAHPPCGYRHYTFFGFLCNKHQVKHMSKQYSLDRL